MVRAAIFFEKKHQLNLFHLGIPEFNVLAKNITVLGFSPLFPDAHCTAKGDVCELVTGESGIHPNT
jgi:purine nucleoside permease